MEPHRGTPALQKLCSQSRLRGLDFYNLKTQFRGLLPEMFELLKAVAFLVIFHPFIDVFLTVLQHPEY
jgi:hypothetical protein